MNDTESTTLHPEQEVAVHLWAYVGCLIIIVGTVGHILSITVMATSKSFRVQCSTVYLISMSAAGIVPLYTGLIRYIIFIGFTNWQIDLRNTTDGVCRFHMTITYTSLQYFAWVQATIAVDRLFAVAIPHKYTVYFHWRIGLVVVIVELVLVCALNMSVAFSVGLNMEGACVKLKKDFFDNVWAYIDLFSYSLLPAGILILCNSTILYLLHRRQVVVSSNRSNMATSITVMLMSLNLLFIITTLPISVVSFLNWGDWGTKRFAKSELVWTIFSLFQYAGSASTFFVYFITGAKFREELRKMPSELCSCRNIFNRQRVNSSLATPTELISINDNTP